MKMKKEQRRNTETETDRGGGKKLHRGEFKNFTGKRKAMQAFTLAWLYYGGLYWTRTSDPIDVNDVLYQLSQQTKSLGTKDSIAWHGGIVNPEFHFFVRNPHASFFMAGFVL